MQVLRCALRQNPSSVLVNDCITALAEGMHPSFYNHFIALLWSDAEYAYLLNTDSCAEAEWESFAGILMKFCKNSGLVVEESSVTLFESSWEFLINSKFHMNYRQKMSSAKAYQRDVRVKACLSNCSHETSFNAQLLLEALDSLHALYESLKLDMLRKRCVLFVHFFMINCDLCLITSITKIFCRHFALFWWVTILLVPCQSRSLLQMNLWCGIAILYSLWSDCKCET